MTPLTMMNDPHSSIAVLARQGVLHSEQQAATIKQFEIRLLSDPEMLPFRLPNARGYVSVPKPVPMWLQPMLDLLMQFAWLPANWDTYGGVAVTKEAFFMALDVIARLMTDGSVSPATVPTS